MKITIGTVIKKYRLKKQISQFSLGQTLGFSRGQYISNIERGHADLPLGKVKSCAEALEINPMLLMNIIIKKKIKHMFRQAKLKPDPKSKFYCPEDPTETEE